MAAIRQMWDWLVKSQERLASKPIHDLRDSPRYNIPLYVPYQGEGPLVERRGNISSGGFCFEGERELEAGSSVPVVFMLPGVPQWIKATGMVLGQVHFQRGLGIRGRFVDIQLKDELRLARWLDEASQRNLHQQTSDI